MWVFIRTLSPSLCWRRCHFYTIWIPFSANPAPHKIIWIQHLDALPSCSWRSPTGGREREREIEREREENAHAPHATNKYEFSVIWVTHITRTQQHANDLRLTIICNAASCLKSKNTGFHEIFPKRPLSTILCKALRIRTVSRFAP